MNMAGDNSGCALDNLS